MNPFVVRFFDVFRVSFLNKNHPILAKFGILVASFFARDSI